MQHDRNQKDFDAIALAVNRLRARLHPTVSLLATGPLFGITRSKIFREHVNNLDSHLGKVLDFYEEDGGKLRLCLDDIHPGNFRKDTSGRLFALDFAKTNFFPFAFQDLAFVDGDDLAEKVGKSLNCPKSKYRGPLRLAAGELQLFNKSSHGLPYSLRQSIGSRDLFE